MNREKALKFNWRRVGVVLLIILLLVLIGVPVFYVANLRNQAHMAFREAKNVKLYLWTLDIEYYANEQTIYDGSSPDGLRAGVYESVEKYLGHDCELMLTSYSKLGRKVTGFIYTYGNFQIIYHYDKQNGDTWKVNFVLDLLDYM